MRIWCERGSVLYQKRIDGRKTWRKSFTCVCSRGRHPLPRNKFSVRNVICTRSGKLSTLQRKLSRATSRVVKSSAVACPSSAVLRRYQRLPLRPRPRRRAVKRISSEWISSNRQSQLCPDLTAWTRPWFQWNTISFWRDSPSRLVNCDHE